MEAIPVTGISGVDPSNSDDTDSVNPNYVDTKTRFAELMQNHRDNAMRQITSEIRDQSDIHDNYIRSARNARWSMNELQERKKVLESQQDSKVENIEKEFDALLRHNKVDAVGIRSGMLLVKTHELTMTDPSTGESKVLGECEISLPLDSNNVSALNVKNLTNARHGSVEAEDEPTTWQHPHVNDYGEPCFGSLESEMIDSLSNGEINATFELMLQYLQSYNPDDDYGRNWALWD